MHGVARRPGAGGRSAEFADDRVEGVHAATRARRRQGRCRIGGSRMALRTSAISEITSCMVTVACQYCQPLNRPLGMVVPLACAGLYGPIEPLPMGIAFEKQDPEPFGPALHTIPPPCAIG